MQLEALAIRPEKSLDFRAVSLPGEGAYPTLVYFIRALGSLVQFKLFSPATLVILSLLVIHDTLASGWAHSLNSSLFWAFTCRGNPHYLSVFHLSKLYANVHTFPPMTSMELKEYFISLSQPTNL